MFLSVFSRAQCIGTFPDKQDFEASAGGWTTGGTASDWAWGKPNKTIITGAGGGVKCWITGGLTGSGYNNGEAAWVKSPCYNFSSLTYPTVGFRVFWESEYNYDGTVLQYSTNNGSTWTNVGSSSDPKNCLNLNWFNTGSIKYLGSDGWSGSKGNGGGCGSGNGSNGWVLSSHTMPYLAGKPNVQFRFLFGAGTNCNGYNGFAFDDFTVGEAVANFASFNFVCTGANTVSFTNTSFLCPALTWDFGDPGSGASNTSTLANPVHTFSAPGQFTVKLTATGPDNAPGSITKVITVLDLNTQVINDPLCNGDANGTVTVTPTPNIAGLNYSWNSSPAQLAATATNLAAGTYVVTVSGTNVCQATDNVTLTDPAALAIIPAITQPSCKNNDGNITLTTSGGTGPYTYMWTPAVSATNTAASLAGGAYSVVIKDKNLCTQTQSFTLTAPSGVTAALTASKDVSCFGAADGSATVTASGGTAPYTYAWSPGGYSNAAVTGLSKNNYSVTVTDAKGCNATASAIINEPAQITSSMATTDAVCSNNNGTATATITGGTAPYIYSWSNGAATAGISNLPAQSYSLTVADKNGCKVNDVANINAVGTTLNLKLSHAEVSCFGGANGIASIEIVGGKAPYTISWSNGGNTEIVDGLIKGTYSVTVKDALNCSKTGSITISEPAAALSVSLTPADALCNGGKGSITSLTSGGTAPYSYAWSNGANTQDIGSVAAASYTLNVSDMNGCKATASAVIKEPAALAVSLTPTDALCNGGKGSIASLTSGGTAPYGYTWSNGANTQDISSVPVASYTLNVSDKNGCKATTSAAVNAPAALAIVMNVQPASCGNNNGSAAAAVSGGVAPYAYAWTPGNATTSSFSDLAAGNYGLLVTDKNGCQQNATAGILASAALSLQLSHTDVSCFGGATGTATVVANGGKAPYTISWSNGANTATAGGLIKGTYTVSVKDALGCSNAGSVTIAEPAAALAVSLTPADALCNGGKGSITSLAGGGTAPYGYAWSNGASTQDISSVAAASYMLNVSDKNGCKATASAIINEPAALAISFTIQNASCGSSNGSIKTLVSGGILPLSYAWNPGNQATADLLNIGSGKYTLTVTDKNGCTASNAASVITPGNMLVQTTAINPLCNGDKNGTAAVTVSGGTPGYAVQWSTGETSNAIKNLAAGNYTVTVKDATGCTTSSNIAITAPAALQLVLDSTAATCTSNDGSIVSTVSGGVAPYLYSWQPGNVSTPQLSNAAAGKYMLTVTDKNGCSTGRAANVTSFNPLSISLGKDTSICGANGFSITPGAFSGYSWQNGSISPSIAISQPGKYWVTVKDQRGCTASDTLVVMADCGEIWFPSAFTPNGDGRNDEFGALGNLSLISNYSLTVFNRWGVKVFESYNPSYRWNGTYKGSSMIGNYVWFARYRGRTGGEVIKKGSLVLVR